MQKMTWKLILLTLAASLLAGCAQGDESPAASPTTATSTTLTQAPDTEEPRTLTIMTHDSFAMSAEVQAAFETQHNVRLQFLSAGDTGAALNKAILSIDNPLADVFYGVDNTYLSRGLEEGIFEPYSSPALASIPDEFKLDPENRALPVDYGDVCLNYDKAYFEEAGIEPPANLEDLLKPDYRSLLVVENPAASSPGLAFLLATIGTFGEDGYLDYWQGLVENDVLVVNDWETAYYTEFSGSSGHGPRPIVVSYGSSPPFEVIYADPPIDAPPTAVVTGDGSCFRQIEFVGILVGTPNRDLAEVWIDFMLSEAFQEDLPLQMFVFPVNPHAQLDEVFVEHMVVPESTAVVSPEAIAENREKWLEAWTETVLR